MLGVAIEICRYVSDACPGFVECRLTDASDREWVFIDKVPIVTTEILSASSSYPRPGIITCQVIERRQVRGQELVTIDTELPSHIETIDGDTRFEVRSEQLLEFDWGSTL